MASTDENLTHSQGAPARDMPLSAISSMLIQKGADKYPGTHIHIHNACITTSEKGLSSPILYDSLLCCLQFWRIVEVTLPHLREIFPQHLEKLNLRKLCFFHCTSCKWWLTTRMEWYGLQGYTALHRQTDRHIHTPTQRCTLAPPPLHVASLATPSYTELVWPDYTSAQSPVHKVKGIHDYSRL